MHAAFFRVFEEHLSDLSRGCVLMFSTGKDAVATLDILTRIYSIKPKLVYWNCMPFLMSMHKQALDFYAERYGVEYEVVTHFDVVQDIAAKIGQRVPTYKEWLIKLYYDQGERLQVFGVKASDNLTAKMMTNKGARMALHRIYPLVDWKDAHVFRYLEEEGVPLIKNYSRGFRDINDIDSPDTLEYLREYFPEDYGRLIALEPWRLANV